MSLVRFQSEPPSAGLAHLVERHLAKVEVASSSLVTRSSAKKGSVLQDASLPATNGSVAQLVEQGTENPRVTGSIPVGATSAAWQRAGGLPRFPARRFSPKPRRKRCGTSPQGPAPQALPVCGFSSSGRAPPCQGGGSEFEPRNPLQTKKTVRKDRFFVWSGPPRSAGLSARCARSTRTEGPSGPHLRAKSLASLGCAPKRLCGGSLFTLFPPLGRNPLPLGEGKVYWKLGRCPPFYSSMND